MKVLVTGGAGFIGSHIVDALIEAGHDVAVVDDLSTGSKRNLNPKARFYQVSITDFDALGEVFGQEKPELVNHHAAQTSVRNSMADPSFDGLVNVVGSINLLRLSVDNAVERFIFASTCAVYSEPQHIPMEEGHPIGPQSAYGSAKAAVEGYVRMYSEVHGLRHKIFRYGNVFGPRQNPEGEAGVVAIFTRQMLGGEQSTIFGDGGKTRDYVSVSDVVHANILAMDERGDNEVYNIARGIEVSDFEIFDAVRNAAGADVEPLYADKRPGEADRVSLNCSRAVNALDWNPATGLADGIAQVVDYHRE
jgi:UDP-glucose 4-epimerase